MLARADHSPKAGSKHQVVKKVEMKDAPMKIGAGDESVDATFTLQENSTETIEFIAADKIRLTISAASASQSMTVEGDQLPMEGSRMPLLKIPVILTKTDALWTAALEDGAIPTDAQKSELKKREKELDPAKEAKLYGTAPRKIGESWSLDASLLPFAKNQKEAKGRMEVTLKAIEEYDAKKCARLKGPMELTARSEKGDAEITIKGTVVILRSLEDLVDLKTGFTGRTEITGKNLVGTTSIAGDMTMERTVKMD